MVKLVKYIYTTYGYLYALNLIMGYRNPTGNDREITKFAIAGSRIRTHDHRVSRVEP